MKNNDLSYTKEKEAISIVLGNFAQALNNGEINAVANFFDHDAIFIPDGMKKGIMKIKHGIINDYGGVEHV